MVEVIYSQNASTVLQVSGTDAVVNTVRPFGGPSRTDSWRFSREEHSLRELGLRQKGMVRAPKRSHTHAEYHVPSAPVQLSTTVTLYNISPRPLPDGVSVPETIPEMAVLLSQPVPVPGEQASRLRPPLGPPRRSHSVTDQEPEPQFHRLSGCMTLEDLPTELHYVLFDFLDPIDSTCLGLTNKHFYDIHRRMHGAVPLSVRRQGPNELEWTWHLANRPLDTRGKPCELMAMKDADGKESLAMLRIRGQGLCRKCGISRCELHKHIQDWMGENYEYCEIRQKFGPVAPEGARSVCSMSNPQNPSRCGRHRDRKSRLAVH